MSAMAEFNDQLLKELQRETHRKHRRNTLERVLHTRSARRAGDDDRYDRITRRWLYARTYYRYNYLPKEVEQRLRDYEIGAFLTGDPRRANHAVPEVFARVEVTV